MRLSACEPFGENRFLFRERLFANGNGALHHRDLSLLSLIPAYSGPAKIAAKADRMSIAAAVGMAIGLFIGPVSCLMLGIWNAALNSNGGKHDHYDVGNQGIGFAGKAQSSRAQHG
ncbi:MULTISPECIES: hypothetical protein [unclassified Mesorhizobium]|uniref:hypothetical protein n=1 Tax=unclassified Mesorhizobium TaxID=325217 RepID=UPI000F751210|nr:MULTISPECIES: hypothetical protein [unclassified Mesorhizobium]AZO06448.1 hypothetical protein EJ068_27790 [Mesorhizobium sp. M2A.F.Ca.ET.043.02.1.1]RUW67580.1 hypothetical protein EOA28_28770 [Mesorhizobium sp. M2A.F.Ca.ET.067.02.1.1]